MRQHPAEGKLTFLDNQVDRNTGTIHLKATFANQDRRLWPGQYVNVVLTLAMLDQALTVPSQSVQMGQNGTYTYVVKSDQTAEIRSVQAGDQVGGELIVKSGLKAGERVVTDGQINLIPGARVEIRSQEVNGTLNDENDQLRLRLRVTPEARPHPEG